MTLCVAWYAGNNIHFASDSRITEKGKYSDNAIKVMPVSIRVFSPNDSNTDKMETVFNKTYGMCFSGSFTGAYVVREFLISTLQQLQYIPGHVEVSFLQICRIIYKFYNYLICKLYDELDSDHIIEFFIAGYCPKDAKLKMGRFYIYSDDNYDTFVTKWNILDNKHNNIYAIGSGDDQFFHNYDKLGVIQNINIRVINAIKDTIDNNIISTVGGHIQYGTFDNSCNFSTSGIMYREYDGEGLLTKIGHYYAGVNMLGDEFDPKDDELFIMGSYIDPFCQ
jgi:hypothetical protein